MTTMELEELNARIDEAEAEIDAGEVLTCEEANAEVREALPWLDNPQASSVAFT